MSRTFVGGKDNRKVPGEAAATASAPKTQEVESEEIVAIPICAKSSKAAQSKAGGLLLKTDLQMREGTYSRSSFTINNDGTWTAEEAGGHTFRHSKAASSAEGKGSWKKVGSNYEFSVEKYEAHNSDSRSQSQDYQGKIISRTINEIDTAGAFKSLFFDIDLTLNS